MEVIYSNMYNHSIIPFINSLNYTPGLSWISMPTPLGIKNQLECPPIMIIITPASAHQLNNMSLKLSSLILSKNSFLFLEDLPIWVRVLAVNRTDWIKSSCQKDRDVRCSLAT